MAQVVKRAYKYRFYPTSGQAEELARTFGCVRLVYNKALQERTRVYALEGRRVSYVESSAQLTEWKRSGEFDFLSEVSSVPPFSRHCATFRRPSRTSSPSGPGIRRSSPARGRGPRPSTRDRRSAGAAAH
ncbi:hypothetical protein GCM10020001_032680 [Nonomuraea salmonea]